MAPMNENKPETEKFWNIPNILSLYRLCSFPLVLYFAINANEKLFVIFLIINLITDILDGLIARVFKQETKIGAKLDSIADLGTYILAILGIVIFKATDFSTHILSISIYFALFLAPYIFSFLKFRKMTSLHLYSSKIAGYVQGIFFFVLFLDKFYIGFYYFTIIYTSLTFIEELMVQALIKDMQSNLKGIYWILKSHEK